MKPRPRKKKKYKGLTLERDRHGKFYWRFRKTRNGKTVSCNPPGNPGDYEFEQAIKDALNNARPKRKSNLPERGTLARLCLDYQKSSQWESLSEKTRRLQLSYLDRLITFMGDAKLVNIRPAHVERVMQAFDGPNAMNKARSVLSKLFDYAARYHNFTLANPARLAQGVAVPGDGFRSWPDESIHKYRMTHKTSTLERRVLELALCTAAARGDLVAMSRQNIKDGTITYTRMKTGVAAIGIPITPKLAVELDHIPPDQFMLLVNEKGESFNPNALSTAFARWTREAGLKDHSIHGSRKARGRLLAEAGATSHEVGAWLGHKRSTTAERYTRDASRAKLVAGAADKLKNVVPFAEPFAEPNRYGGENGGIPRENESAIIQKKDRIRTSPNSMIFAMTAHAGRKLATFRRSEKTGMDHWIT